jgi:hypothetical protein
VPAQATSTYNPTRLKEDPAMRTLTRSLALLAALLVSWPAAFSAAEEGKGPVMDPFGQMTVDEVEHRLGQPNVYVYDGNSDETYHNSHIPGAVRLLSRNITAEKLPADKNATLIFYCHNML